MPWMLMTQSPPHAPAHVEPRQSTVPTASSPSVEQENAIALETQHDPPFAASTTNHRPPLRVCHPQPVAAMPLETPILPATNERPAVPRLPDSTAPVTSNDRRKARDAWILFGDVERALIQAGMLEELREALPTPERIYASGVSAVNAMLWTSKRAASIARSWEALRSAHFLIPAALIRVAAMGWSQALAADLAAKATHVLKAEAGRSRETTVILVADDGLRFQLDAPAETSEDRWRETFLRDDNAPAPLAATIAAIAKTSVDRVLIFGLDARLRGHPLVVSAAERANGDPLKLVFLAAESNDSPGILAYLLPGLGGPERLIRDGKTVAREWLEKNC